MIESILQMLVALQTAEMADLGVEVTAASYVRGLIRHEARARGLEDPSLPTTSVSFKAHEPT